MLDNLCFPLLHNLWVKDPLQIQGNVGMDMGHGEDRVFGDLLHCIYPGGQPGPYSRACATSALLRLHSPPSSVVRVDNPWRYISLVAAFARPPLSTSQTGVQICWL
jgi:hypothetical protein